MADARLIISAVLYALWWPVSHVFKGLVFLLTPVWTLASFILLPFIHLAHTLFTIVTYPFSVQWLERIETLYVYLGTAALIGCVTGGVIFVFFKFLSSSLNIDSALVPQPRDRIRTTADFRAARREKKEGSIHPSPAPTPVVLKKVAGSGRRGLFSQIIIEEEDSDF